MYNEMFKHKVPITRESKFQMAYLNIYYRGFVRRYIPCNIVRIHIAKYTRLKHVPLIFLIGRTYSKESYQ